MSETKRLVITREGLQKMKEELEYKETTEKMRIAEQLKIAISYGDLSENAEYDAAKDKEAQVNGRINEIEQLLNTATFVDDTQTSLDVVNIGCRVKVYDMEYDEEDEYTIVGYTEADPMKLWISSESPIGEALMGARIGETVKANTPGGIVQLKVLEIARR